MPIACPWFNPRCACPQLGLLSAQCTCSFYLLNDKVGEVGGKDRIAITLKYPALPKNSVLKSVVLTNS